MVKNTTGGSKHKKLKNSSVKAERPLIIKEDANEGYGQVMLFLGGSMVMIRKLGTPIQFRCRLRKSLPRVFKNDIVLYAMREFESKDVGDVMLVYTSDEVNILKKEKYIEVEAELDEIFDEENDNIEKEEQKDDEEDDDIDMNEL
jgi:hypothetical protein